MRNKLVALNIVKARNLIRKIRNSSTTLRMAISTAPFNSVILSVAWLKYLININDDRDC
ncbi:MAG: hypothetical protein K2G37_01975 [Clostridia bacterium]|nr:hypothetical protein [Clostridia bacterium]MDE7329442.1 hypothetical protein [Clostridia bacterium]